MPHRAAVRMMRADLRRALRAGRGQSTSSWVVIPVAGGGPGKDKTALNWRDGPASGRLGRGARPAQPPDVCHLLNDAQARWSARRGTTLVEGRGQGTDA